jgi:hypothetical protein
LAAFVAEARAAGVRLPFPPGVADYIDKRLAGGCLLRFPGLGLDAARVAHVLAAPTRWGPDVRRRCARAWAVRPVDGRLPDRARAVRPARIVGTGRDAAVWCLGAPLCGTPRRPDVFPQWGPRRPRPAGVERYTAW